MLQKHNFGCNLHISPEQPVSTCWGECKMAAELHHRFYLVLQLNRIGTLDCWRNITIWPYLLFTVRLHDRCYTSKYMRKFAQFEGAHVSCRPNSAIEGQVTFRAVTIHMGILVEIGYSIRLSAGLTHAHFYVRGQMANITIKLCKVITLGH